MSYSCKLTLVSGASLYAVPLLPHLNHITQKISHKSMIDICVSMCVCCFRGLPRLGAMQIIVSMAMCQTRN